jgi:hypothetical protein
MTGAEWRRSWPAWLRATFIGVPFGCIPAGGSEIPTFLSYATEKKLSKHKEEFGTTGAIEGVAGPEAANNAAITATLIPLLTLGIPTSNTTAILLGAFQNYGINPGPQLFDKNAALAAQQVLKQTAAAQEDTIAAQTRAAEKSAALSKAQGDAEAGKIAAIGRALRENPEYLRYVQMQQLPAIYEKAGAQGNLIMLPADTNAFLQLPGAKAPAAAK